MRAMPANITGKLQAVYSHKSFITSLTEEEKQGGGLTICNFPLVRSYCNMFNHNCYNFLKFNWCMNCLFINNYCAG